MVNLKISYENHIAAEAVTIRHAP